MSQAGRRPGLADRKLRRVVAHEKSKNLSNSEKGAPKNSKTTRGHTQGREKLAFI